MSHVAGVRYSVLAPRSKLYQGPFGRLFPELPAWSPHGVGEPQIDAHFLGIANDQMVELPGKKPGEIASDATLIDQLETQFGSKIPAGYTYFGQFIDHDITFDPASSLVRRNDPSGLLNFRTPRLDLDNVYGRGPDDQPYLYDQSDKNADGKVDKMLIGRVECTSLRDLPRNGQGRALIGDMRNDENSVVCQLQLAFLLAHNELAQRARDLGVDDTFEAARRTLRWLYQYVLWNDFVRRIAVDEVYRCALSLEKTCDGRCIWKCGLDDVFSWKHTPFMPIEFSAAVYRFGHSMVRNSYQTNDPHRGAGSFAPIFDNTGTPNPDDLRGFRPLAKENYVQWDWFLDMTSSAQPRFPQKARKIDTKLSNALAFLHEDLAGSPLNVLAYRNLKRGWTFELPSGSDVARKLCLPVTQLGEDEPDALWFYVLKEAASLPGANAGEMLGRVGSVILCATFAGLLKGDPCSYLNVRPDWSPDQDPLLKSGQDDQDDSSWTLASIIRLSGLPVDAGDVSNQT